MAWTSPLTFTAAQVLTAAQLNTHLRDNLKALLPLDALAWTSYTPTLGQPGAVTKTVTYAKYTQSGKTIHCEGRLAVTGPGTANTKITVSLPVTAAVAASVPCGSGWILDASAALIYTGIATLDSTTTLALFDSSINTATTTPQLGLTGTQMSAALANTDAVTWFVTYEAA